MNDYDAARRNREAYHNATKTIHNTYDNAAFDAWLLGALLGRTDPAVVAECIDEAGRTLTDLQQKRAN